MVIVSAFTEILARLNGTIEIRIDVNTAEEHIWTFVRRKEKFLLDISFEQLQNFVPQLN